MYSRLLIGSASMPSNPSRPATAEPMRSLSAVASLERGRVGRGEGAQDRQRPAGVRAGRVDRDLGRVAQALDARPVLVPLGESLAPGLGRRRREVLDRLALAGRLARVHPGLEVGRPRGPETSAAGCRCRPWGRWRWPAPRRWRPPRAATGTGRSCRCRSCRCRPRGWSGRGSRRAGRRRAPATSGRIPGRGRRRRAFRSWVGSWGEARGGERGRVRSVRGRRRIVAGGQRSGVGSCNRFVTFRRLTA